MIFRSFPRYKIECQHILWRKQPFLEKARPFTKSRLLRANPSKSLYLLLALTTAVPAAYLFSQTDSAQASLRVMRAITTGALISFDYKYSLLGVHEANSKYDTILEMVHERSARRLLALFQKNGGVYIKIGQHLAALEYVLPKIYCDTMKVLQCDAPVTPLYEVRKLFKQEVKEELEDIFSEFDPIPIGAASLAQVHRALLRSTGEAVAVKVQHPFIRTYADMDIATVALANRAITFLFPDFELTWLVEEMRTNLPLEINFVQEGMNAERTEQALRKRFPFVRIPRIYWEWSTPRVLIMEFMDGAAKIVDPVFLQKHHISPSAVSCRVNQIFSEMMFINGFVHCDPHPGNLLIRPKYNSSAFLYPGFLVAKCLTIFGLNPFLSTDFELILLDHGLYKQLTHDFRIQYAKLWLALVEGDEQQIEACCLKLGGGHLYQLISSILTQRNWDSIKSKKPLTEMEEAKFRAHALEAMPDVAHLLSRIPRQMVLMLKTNDLLRSIDRDLRVNHSMTSWLVMVDYCTRAVGADWEQQTDSFTVWWGSWYYTLKRFQFLLLRWLVTFHPTYSMSCY